MASSSSVMKYEKRDNVAWLTMNRPEAMNAFNTDLRDGLVEAFETAARDSDVLAIVLTGEGGRAFSAGADLKEMASRDSSGAPVARVPPRSVGNFFATVGNCPKPTIAAIDGHCIAAGLEVALMCDIRVATEKSTFGLPEARRSLMPDPGLIELMRVIPLGEALKILFTARPISAARAYDIGLIQALVPDRDAVMAEAAEMAADIALGAPLAIEAYKQIVKTGRSLPPEQAAKLREAYWGALSKTEDRIEGPRAFAEKRAPVWKRR